MKRYLCALLVLVTVGWSAKIATGDYAKGSGSTNPDQSAVDWQFKSVAITTTLSAGGAGFSVDADGDATAKSYTVTKASGVAGDLGLYEANSSDTHAAGFRGPASITGDGAYRGLFPNARASAADQVLTWTNGSESGSGTAADPYVQTMAFTQRGYALTPVIDDPDNFAANFTGANLYGGTFICNAAGTAVLPEATAGMNFTIVLEGANAVIIDPLGTGTADTIVMNGLAAAGDENITSSTSGAMCVFQYRAANSWMATCNGFAEASPP